MDDERHQTEQSPIDRSRAAQSRSEHGQVAQSQAAHGRSASGHDHRGRHERPGRSPRVSARDGVRLTRPESDRRPRTATRGGDRSPTFGEGRRAVVLVVSTTAAAGTAVDSAGPLLVGWLSERGYRIDAAQIVPDGPAVGEALAHHLQELPEAERPRILVTTGGTGLAPDDHTPEETRRFLEKEATGIVQALVDHGLAKLPEAAMSRGTAGAVGRTFVVNLPGSVGGVKDGMTVLDPILHHIQAQLEDGLDGATAADDGVHPPREQATKPEAHAEQTELVAQAEVVAQGSHLTVEPIDATAGEAHVVTSRTGAVALFRGVVRDHDSGREGVVVLEYTAHPDADRIFAEVLDEAHRDYPDVRLWARHRVGRLAVGDDALVVVAASAHRGQAFAACAELVDRIKARVPIWKRQEYADGTHDWVGIE